MPRSLTSLVQSAKSGDPQAVSDLVGRFQPLIRRLLRTYRHLPFSEDLPGEVYLIVAGLVQQYDPQRGIPFPHYLGRMLPATIYTVVRRECRTNGREVPMILFEREEAMSHDSFDSSHLSPHPGGIPQRNDVVDQVMVKEMIRQIQTNLTPLQASVFTRRVLEGEDFRQIADHIGSSPGAVRFVYHSARQRLRKRSKQLMLEGT